MIDRKRAKGKETQKGTRRNQGTDSVLSRTSLCGGVAQEGWLSKVWCVKQSSLNSHYLLYSSHNYRKNLCILSMFSFILPANFVSGIHCWSITCLTRYHLRDGFKYQCNHFLISTRHPHFPALSKLIYKAPDSLSIFLVQSVCLILLLFLSLLISFLKISWEQCVHHIHPLQFFPWPPPTFQNSCPLL